MSDENAIDGNGELQNTKPKNKSDLESILKREVSKPHTILERIQAKLQNPDHKPFKLAKNFLKQYEDKDPNFGFGELGEFTYLRTYSRVKEDGVNEVWWETVRRVVEGTYNMQKRHILDQNIHWNEPKAQRSAKEMYERMFEMKFLPPGRGLWAMGSEITEERGLFAALNNCAFVSTKNLKEDGPKPFTFLMDMSMLGVGVGFDTKGAGTFVVKGPDYERHIEEYEIPDSREGWVKSVEILINSYFQGGAPVTFDYSIIRPEGMLIKGFGGKSSGPEPLKVLHEKIRDFLDDGIGKPISDRTIVDIENAIGKCVVAGNVRRTAEIVFGDPDSEDFLDLKNYGINPDRKEFGWASNNSVFARVGMDYNAIAQRIVMNGEPGLAWLDNMRGYSRMNGPKDNKDHRASGGNPCLEQTLESYELCCLVETFPNRCEDKEDFLRTLKFAYLYAKTVTLGSTHWPETNEVLLRNRRIGCSMSGIVQFMTEKDLDELKKWSSEGYDVIQKYDLIYSDWFKVPKSIKTTSIKPSGTVSLLAGATPGLHFPEAKYYIRRVRIDRKSDLIKPVQEAGYHVEPEIDYKEVSKKEVRFEVIPKDDLDFETISSDKVTALMNIVKELDDGQIVICKQNIVEDLKDGKVKVSDKKISVSLENGNYLIEKKSSTNMVVSFPVHIEGDIRTTYDVSMWEKLGIAAFMQEHWADNQVSCTVDFNPVTEGPQLPYALDHYQYKLKGISFLPKTPGGAYKQMPYEPITREVFEEMNGRVRKVNYGVLRNVQADVEKFCNTDHCLIHEPLK